MREFLSRRRFLVRSGVAAALSAGVAPGVVGAAPKEKIKVGQIGVGHAHAAGKMGAYRRSDDWEVVGCVEPDDGLRERAQRSGTYKDLKWMTRDELLAVPGLQAVAVETRVKDLLENAEACVDAGMHIHVDKPAGSSLPRFKRILDKATKKKLVVQMGYMYRYNPAVVLLRDMLKKGWLGEPYELHTVMSKVVSANGRKEIVEYPGGLMFELGCHITDLAVGILGKPTKVSGIHRKCPGNSDGLLDNMLAVLEYPNAVATVKSSGREVQGFARRHLCVVGTEGTFHIQPLDNPSARVALRSDRGKYKSGYQDVKFPRYVRYIDDAADLAKVIRGEKEHDFPPEHDLAVQETILTACGLPLDR